MKGLQIPQIVFRQLTIYDVHKFSPSRRASLNKIKTIWRKIDASKIANHITDSRKLVSVQEKLLLPPCQPKLQGVRNVCVRKFKFHQKVIMPMRNHFNIFSCSCTSANCCKIDCFQCVGFPLRIFAKKKIDTLLKLNLLRG